MTAVSDALAALIEEGRDLSEAEASTVLDEIMSGASIPPTQIAALLTALRAKGETIDEIVGFARVMREKSLRIVVPGVDRIVDVVGTGGDAPDTFNVSTAGAFVVAGCGVTVAKHGNRAMSSRCGSADVLEALGAVIDLPPAAMAACIRETGVGFLFAQSYHPAMRFVGPVRRELGFRTVFNILGPLTNPAGTTQMAVGVATPEIGEQYAQVLGRLGSPHALVVHGQEGIDEVSPSGPDDGLGAARRPRRAVRGHAGRLPHPARVAGRRGRRRRRRQRRRHARGAGRRERPPDRLRHDDRRDRAARRRRGPQPGRGRQPRRRGDRRRPRPAQAGAVRGDDAAHE